MIKTHVALGISLFLTGSLVWASEPSDKGYIDELSKWIRVLEESQTLSSKQVETLGTFVSAHSKDARVHRLMAKAYGKIGTPDFACSEVETAWRLDPYNFDDLTTVLRYYTVNHETEKFTKLVDESFSKYKEDATALSAMGQFLIRNGDYESAERFFIKANEINPHDALIQVFLIETLIDLNKSKEAFAKAEELTSNPATAPVGLYLRGKALCKMRRYTEACQFYGKAYRQEKKTADLSEAYFSTLMRCGKYKEALEPGLQFIALVTGQNSQVESTKRELIVAMKNLPWQDVNGAIQNTLKGNPSPNFYFSLGDILDQLGRPRQAIQFYAKGIELNPHYGTAFMRIGQDMEKNSKYWGEALQLYERAYSLNPADPEVEARYKRFFSRFPHKDKDIALRLKDWVHR